MRPIAAVGWLAIVGALLVWQGLGLIRGPEWPRLSDFFRDFMRPPPDLATSWSAATPVAREDT
jgi:hypothetical protein